jgi:hypothetical protein
MHAKALQKPKSETKSRRIDAAIKFLQEHKDMSLRKAAQIFDVAHTSISRRQLGHVNSQEQWAAQRQLLTHRGSNLDDMGLAIPRLGFTPTDFHENGFGSVRISERTSACSFSHISHTFVHRFDHLVV